MIRDTGGASGFGVGAGLIDARQRLLDVRRRRIRRIDAALDEKFAQLGRHIRAGNEIGNERVREFRKGVFGELPNFRIVIRREQHQQPELFERARRERALRRQQANIAGNFTAPEKIQQRRAQAGGH